MAAANKGDFSIKGRSVSKVGGNTLEITRSGSGSGQVGGNLFQEKALDTLQDIIRNHQDPDYTRSNVVGKTSYSILLSSTEHLPNGNVKLSFNVIDGTYTFTYGNSSNTIQTITGISIGTDTNPEEGNGSVSWVGNVFTLRGYSNAYASSSRVVTRELSFDYTKIINDPVGTHNALLTPFNVNSGVNWYKSEILGGFNLKMNFLSGTPILNSDATMEPDANPNSAYVHGITFSAPLTSPPRFYNGIRVAYPNNSSDYTAKESFGIVLVDFYTNPSDTIYLLYTPHDVVSPPVNSSGSLLRYLLKDHNLTGEPTTTITDPTFVKFLTYLATQTFPILRESAKLITESEIVENFDSTHISARLSRSISNQLFGLYVVVQ